MKTRRPIGLFSTVLSVCSCVAMVAPARGTDPAVTGKATAPAASAEETTAVDESPAAGLPEALELGPELTELAAECGRAFDLVGRLVDAKHEEVAGKTRASLTAELRAALAAWDRSVTAEASGGGTGGRRAGARTELARVLEKLRGAVGLDLLLVVTQDGDVVSAPENAAGPAATVDTTVAGGEETAAGAFRKRLLRSSENVFLDARAAVSAQTLTAELDPETGPRLGLFLTAAEPLFLRPDAPYCAVVGAASLAAYADGVRALLERSDAARLDWHVFASSPSGTAILIAGPLAGQPPAAALVNALRERATSTAGAAAGDPAVGRWTSVLTSDGEIAGGWGITVDSVFLRTMLPVTKRAAGAATAARQAPPTTAPRPGSTVRAARDGLWELLRGLSTLWGLIPAGHDKLVLLILGASCAFGVVVAILLLIIGARRRRRTEQEVPSVEGLAEAPTVLLDAEAAPGEREEVGDGDSGDLTTLFERNWRTFASYMQDVLQESLENIERAPHQDVKEVRERVELALEEVVKVRKEISRIQQHESQSASEDGRALIDALMEIKNGLSIARDEVRNSSNGVVRRLTAALKEGAGENADDSPQSELMGRVELELLETKQELALVNETVLKVAELFGDRQAQDIERRIRAEVTNVEASFEERAREQEDQLRHAGEQLEELRRDLEEAKENERALRDDLEESERALGEEKARTAFLSDEREAAWRRERRVVEQLREAEQRGKQAPEEQRALEESCRELEKAVEDYRAREGDLRRDLESHKKRDEEAREQLKELYRQEGRMRQEFDDERQRILAQVEQLQAKNAELEEQLGDDPGERDRLRGEVRAQERELESLQNAFAALKDERQHLESEVRRLDEEVAARERGADAAAKSLRQELAQVKAELAAKHSQLTPQVNQAELHDETVDQLRAALAERDADLSRREIELAELQNQLDSIESAASSAEVDELQKALIDAGRELRQSLQERLSLNAQIKEREAEWQSRLSALELQVAEANRQLTDSKNRLTESDQVIKELESQLETVHDGGPTDSRTSDRLEDLQREKEELVEALDRIRNELETFRDETDRLRGFQGTLIEGSIPTAIVACDAELEVFAWNTAAEKLWRRSAGEARGRKVKDLDIIAAEEITSLAKRALHSGAAERLTELTCDRPGGSSLHLRVGCDPIRSPQNGIQGVVICAADVTAEVEQRTEAQVQNLFAESLAESLPSALIILDGRDRITSWNHVAEAMFGISSSEAIGRDLFILDTPLRRSAFKRRFMKTKLQGKHKKLRVRLEVKGVPTQCLVTQCPFKNKQRSACGTLLLIEESRESRVES